ncbi:Phage gp6-like head-tail connector protein [[Clostridium] sordellii]|uniref:phage head-tail connector protein n=1 Tax=Paraclostridium sordellii TaxID=1505 RepID=UPI0005E757F9|nr:phage head-tail connector protein [Paeniclostridium sordellii]MCQ4696509.1 phage head-tail connector protein [Paeniclostridium sordellii]MDU2148208.1 phage head-tail connector protein [Paeniclostridium sordellii]MDU6482345.1 phage head-tail connector protein [Paeniclostridium sordellii]CEO23633.1 Phage gp6-like head-tail connector protein [[Clostridium] sordellii] [Paeniclostridium sordellii]CEP89834.1 Phage gp6-like head-tail connector protein [[Clostridium] sordellii] [Paeniclostridium so
MNYNLLVEKIKRRSNSANNIDCELLNDLIEETQNEILQYTNLLEIPIGLEGSLIEIVIAKCNKLGSEGIKSESFSGISTTYIDGFSKNITKKLNRYRKLPR